MRKIVFWVFLLVFYFKVISQENQNTLKFSGNFKTDQRFLLKGDNDYVWNENRLDFLIDKKIPEQAIFKSKIWVRNFGFTNLNKINYLQDKNSVDPVNIKIREAYLQVNHFLSDKIDLTIGRQIVNWGKADKFNPTNNVNPYDLEDLLDFGRQRGIEILKIDYYFNKDFSAQGVIVPFFKPHNLPTGIWSDVLMPQTQLPQGMKLKNFNDSITYPQNTIKSSSAGVRFKGIIKQVDFSVSYLWCYDALPYSQKNIVKPLNLQGDVQINSVLSFYRNHVYGADVATSIKGVGLWAEAAVFVPETDVVMQNDFSAFYPLFTPIPIVKDSIILKKLNPYVKFVVGGDYNFSDGSYVNAQFLHGFIHEKGTENLNDYFFIRYEKNFFNNKLKISPISGGVVISDWKKAEKNYSIVYLPELSYKPNDDVEISLSTAIFDGKGNNIFANLKDKNMFLFKLNYSF